MSILKKIKNTYRKHQEAMKRFSDEEILMVARDNEGHLTARILARRTSLNYIQASIKLNILYNKGYFKTVYSKTGEAVLELKPDARKQITHLSSANRFAKLSDAEVLKAAVNTGGRLTPASLCVVLDCTIAQAQQKLDELQLQDIFRLEITDKGSIIYVLNDEELFQTTPLKKIG